ncbi:MAG: hypothetical protein EP329_02135 [Deltaproteobacteria bacterium]|nr:MAG: hypothetical protein EP329_02135 [Deltaproteobacteria bacterium]
MTEISESRVLTWTPDPGQQITFWDTGGGPEEREEVAVSELVVTLPHGPIAVRCEVDRETYLRMQSRRWFGIPLRFDETIGMALAADLPVVLEVETFPIDDGGIDLAEYYDGIVDEGDDAGILAEIVRSFTAPVEEDYDLVISPLNYWAMRVSQVDASGAGQAFTRDRIVAWEQGR